jgi:TrmH family RNA methyltransferase
MDGRTDVRYRFSGTVFVKQISSRDNALFKQLKKLASSARERKKSQKALLDGAHLVAACLDREDAPEWLVVADSALHDPEIRELTGRVPENRIVILEAPLFNEISTVESPTGIAALISIPIPPSAPNARFCVLLESVQDPGNLGSILRSAAAAGCDSAWLSADCADAWSPKVLRSGMGAHFLLNILEHQDLVVVAENFSGKVLAAALQGKNSLFQCDLSGNLALVVGNEGAGISTELLAQANLTAHIPMPGGTESLNVAAAAAICLFERVRQNAQ